MAGYAGPIPATDFFSRDALFESGHATLDAEIKSMCSPPFETSGSHPLNVKQDKSSIPMYFTGTDAAGITTTVAGMTTAAAALDQNALKTGLEDGRAGLPDVLPEFKSFMKFLRHERLGLEKIVALQDTSVRDFRRARSALQRSANSGRQRKKSPGNISKEANNAGLIFQRQMGLALLEHFLPTLIEKADTCRKYRLTLPRDVEGEIDVYRALLDSGGMACLHEHFMGMAEEAGEAVREAVLTRMSAMNSACSAIRKRNNAASRKSDAKRAKLAQLTRQQVQHILRVHQRLQDAVFAEVFVD